MISQNEMSFKVGRKDSQSFTNLGDRLRAFSFAIKFLSLLECFRGRFGHVLCERIYHGRGANRFSPQSSELNVLSKELRGRSESGELSGDTRRFEIDVVAFSGQFIGSSD